jgi:molybdate transport system substrate-binding protein
VQVALVAALVAAAISLKAPLEDAAKRFVALNPGEPVTFNFGASGQLAQQIEQGAPFDLFISASPVDIERLVVARRIERDTCALVAGNRLVVVIPRGSDPLADLGGLAAPRFRHVAIGNPKTVPVGRYAQEALKAVNLDTVLSPRFVFAENVRQVVDFVARGDVDAGFVYATDVALGGADITQAFTVEARLHKPIEYEGAVVAGSASAARARSFLTFLTSVAGRDTFLKYGFLPPRTTIPK